jgi:hypothetical protein
MATCSICSDERAKEINRWLLTGRRGSDAAREFGFKAQTMRWHRRRHLPYRDRQGKPETVTEKLEELTYQLARLQALAECGVRISGAITAIREQRFALELQMRFEGRLDATHRRLLRTAQPLEGDYKVEFVNGKSRTVPVEAGEK